MVWNSLFKDDHDDHDDDDGNVHDNDDSNKSGSGNCNNNDVGNSASCSYRKRQRVPQNWRNTFERLIPTRKTMTFWKIYEKWWRRTKKKIDSGGF